MPFVFFIWLLIEIAVFILVGEWIGLAWTLALIILTTILGLIILRSQSLAMLKKMHEGMRTGRTAMFMNKETPFIMLAGMLLLIPGFITDLVGLLLLIPALPGLFSSGAAATPKASNDRQHGEKDRVIDGECWEEKQKDSDDKNI